MIGDEMERTMQFILEQQAQFMANIQILQEQRARDEGRLARVERAFVQLTEVAVNANERMNEQEARHTELHARDTERLARLERAFVQLTELAVSANERMNEHDTRLERVEEAVVLLTRLVGGKEGDG
ncbi:MAG TPA: hypothetical protein VGB76_08415 [Pyrinomonadaceae bacterium]|jgi:hypothetical protein